MNKLSMNDYQIQSSATAIYPGKGELLGRCYVGLKLAGEAGEVAEKLGKAIRDSNGDVNVVDMMKEIGDVLWYLAALASELGVTLEEVAQTNLDKLASRAARGVLGGSGDDR